MKKIFNLLIFASVLTVLQGCTTYSTSLNTMEKLRDPPVVNIKQGKTCSSNLFGGFSLPWIGDTAIRIKGDQSVITAIKKAGISHVYSIDFSTVHYVFYSKRCTMVFGY